MQRKARAPMKSFTAGEPLERMAIDIMGELHLTKNGNKCIAVVMDYFTKYVVLLPLPNQKASTVANALVKEVFAKIGIPRALHSDRGTDFLSTLFSETCKLFQIDKTATTPWRPQSDGMVERMNRTLGSMLRQFTAAKQDDWDECLPYCALAYNSSKHSSTSYSPNFLMFGRDFRVPLELILPTLDETADMQPNETSIDHFVRRMQETFQLAYSATRKNLQASTALQKHYYDRKQRPTQLKVGQAVWLYNPRRKRGRTPKLDKPWEGPYVVVKIFGDVICVIQRTPRAKQRIVHIDKLCPTKQQINTDWVFQLPKKSTEVVPADQYEGISQLFKIPPGAAQEKEKSTQQPSSTVESTEECVQMDQPSINRDECVQPEPHSAKVENDQKRTRSGKSYYVEQQIDLCI
jgi:transposase InsO family protein